MSYNKLSKLDVSICELLSIEEDGINFTGNPITDPNESVWSKGIKRIRSHFGWNKVIPKQLKKPEERGNTTTFTKSLSTREKRGISLV